MNLERQRQPSRVGGGAAAVVERTRKMFVWKASENRSELSSSVSGNMLVESRLVAPDACCDHSSYSYDNIVFGTP